MKEVFLIEPLLLPQTPKDYKKLEIFFFLTDIIPLRYFLSFKSLSHYTKSKEHSQMWVTTGNSAQKPHLRLI